jgi:hypothetical protein
VQVKIGLPPKLERCIRRFEEGQERPVVHLEESVQHLAYAASRGLLNIEGAGEAQPQKIFVKFPRLFRIAASIGAVMQSFNHIHSPF